MMAFKTVLFFMAIALTGCATVRQVDNEVRSLSTLKSLPVAGYRFERLPSQQTPQQLPSQTALETMAEQALGAVGLKRDDAQPGYSMLIGATFQRQVRLTWNDPWYVGSGLQVGFGTGRGARLGFGTGFNWGTGYSRYSSPQYHNEVSLVMRDLSTGQVVYETKAVHDGPWTDLQNILPLMFQAALTGFPTPPSEPRLVNMTLQPQAPVVKP